MEPGRKESCFPNIRREPLLSKRHCRRLRTIEPSRSWGARARGRQTMAIELPQTAQWPFGSAQCPTTGAGACIFWPDHYSNDASGPHDEVRDCLRECLVDSSCGGSGVEVWS